MSWATIVGTRRPARDAGRERLPLTSMVDMMTILIVFLLQSFSDDGILLAPSPEVALPVAATGDRPQVSLSIEVTGGEIRIDGTEVCTTVEARHAATVIPQLASALEARSAAVGADEGLRRVLIQCDRGQEFALLKRVLRTCSDAGYENPELLVERSGR